MLRLPEKNSRPFWELIRLSDLSHMAGQKGSSHNGVGPNQGALAQTDSA